MLRRGGVVAAGAVAALAMVEQGTAEATTGGNFLLGEENDANTQTWLHGVRGGSVTLNPFFKVSSEGLSGTSTTMEVDGPGAVRGIALQVNGGGGGTGLVATASNTAGTIGLALTASGSNGADGIHGSSDSGTGVSASSGLGAGVRGSGKRGGVFTGSAANVQLKPAKGAHPHLGQKGDLFVDHNNHLWFCRGGSTWVKLA